MKLAQYIWKAGLLKIKNIKFMTFAIVMMVVTWSYNRPLKALAEVVNYPVSWCVFPFMISNLSFLILFWFGVIYVNSDVPFMQHMNMYQIIRTGRKRWVLGQLGSMFLRSIAVVLFTVICTIVSLIPEIERTMDWGKLLHTISMTDAAVQYNLKYVIYYEIMGKYTPVQLIAISTLICILICMFLSCMMFLISLYSNRVLAVATTTALAVMLFFVVNTHPKIRYILAKFIPTVWAKIAQIKTPVLGYYWLPSLQYMITFLILGIMTMGIFICVHVKKMEFNWEKDDV